MQELLTLFRLVSKMEHKFLPRDLHDFIKEVNIEIENKNEQYYLNRTQPSEDQFLLFA